MVSDGGRYNCSATFCFRQIRIYYISIHYIMLSRTNNRYIIARHIFAPNVSRITSTGTSRCCSEQINIIQIYYDHARGYRIILYAFDAADTQQIFFGFCRLGEFSNRTPPYDDGGVVASLRVFRVYSNFSESSLPFKSAMRTGDVKLIFIMSTKTGRGEDLSRTPRTFHQYPWLTVNCKGSLAPLPVVLSTVLHKAYAGIYAKTTLN